MTKSAVVLDQLRVIERRSFPANEAFDFGLNLRSKPGCIVLLACDTSSATKIVGYVVGVAAQHRMLLHKLCVTSSHQRMGIGELLLRNLIDRAVNMHCRDMALWVDESRRPATALYTKLGFEEQQRLEHYYEHGRTGLKMRLTLDYS